MKDFIKALYVDLIHRVDVVVLDIKNKEHHKDIKDRFISNTLDMLASIRQELQSVVTAGMLEFDEFSRNNIYRFNKLHRRFKAIHSYRYLPIRTYGKPEEFFFRLITRIYQEHRISALPPIVSTISNHDYYYWAVPYFEVIALPSGEEKSLLNLPDLFHEIGHLLHSMFQGKSCEMSGAGVDRHFDAEIVRVQDEGTAQHFQETLEIAKYFWLDSWLEEFSCDLVGTYMTGPAYAWTNLKLLTTGHGSAKIYEYSESHPSDEARMRIILMLLDKLGIQDECKKIRTAWGAFLSDSQIHKPKDYFLLYPDKILQQIVDEFFEFYQNADLASYSELNASGQSFIADILNTAWETAQRNHDAYFKYEEGIIERLRTEFGL